MSKLRVTHLLLHSRHSRPFTADLCRLPSGPPKPLVVFVHGFKGFKDWGHFPLLSHYFAEAGFAFAKLNLSHNGTTPARPLEMADPEAFGRNNISTELDDLDVLINYFHEHSHPELDLQNLFLMGHSRGGGSAVLKAAEDSRVKGLATWAAISDLASRWPIAERAAWKETGVQYVLNTRTGQQLPMYYQLVEDYEHNAQRLHIRAAAARLKQPWLIVHGAEDESVNVQEAHALKAAAPAARLEILEGVNHSFGGQHPYLQAELPQAARTAADLTISFFREQLS